MIPVSKIVPSEDNPNEQDSETFNRLVKSIEAEGEVDENIIVIPFGDKYKIVGGEHRWKAAKIAGIEEIPAVVKDYTEDERKFQLVKRNAIRGKLNPTKFLNLYNDLEEKYEKEVIADMMAMDETEIDKMIHQVRESLPDELKKEFDKAKHEIKTIEDLSIILNTLFTKYGDTLDLNYMVFDYGGKDHLWVRCNKQTWDSLQVIIKKCEEEKKDINEVINALLQQDI